MAYSTLYPLVCYLPPDIDFDPSRVLVTHRSVFCRSSPASGGSSASPKLRAELRQPSGGGGGALPTGWLVGRLGAGRRAAGGGRTAGGCGGAAGSSDTGFVGGGDGDVRSGDGRRRQCMRQRRCQCRLCQSYYSASERCGTILSNCDRVVLLGIA